MNEAHFEAQCEADTDRLGAWLATALPSPCVVCLTGTLGAGKTRLVKAFAAACEVEPVEVVSPTFVLCQHYQGTRTIHHFDVYRLGDDDEFLELGCEEFFETQAVTFVEWGEQRVKCLPRNHLRISIEIEGDNRVFHLQTVGEWSIDFSTLPGQGA